MRIVGLSEAMMDADSIDLEKLYSWMNSSRLLGAWPLTL